MKYNNDSSLLAVCIKLETTNDIRVFIYGSSNYEWYTRFSYFIGQEMSPGLLLEWDPEKSLVIHVIISIIILSLDGEYIYREFVPKIHRSLTNATVAVINGKNVQVTPFKTHTIPPPMFKNLLSCTSQVLDLHILDDFIICLCDESIICFSLQTTKNVSTIILNASGTDVVHKMVRGLENGDICVLQFNVEMKMDQITIYHPNNTNETLLLFDLAARSFTSSNKSLVIQDSHGGLFGIESGAAYKLQESFPSFCHLFEKSNNKWIGLNSRNKLFIESNCISQQCTSYLMTPSFLLTTNLEHRLEIIPISKIDSITASNSESFETRAVEIGAVIVNSTDTSVILQMPRGNLENITPRPLLLAKIQKHVIEGNFRNAFIECRRHRVSFTKILEYDLDFCEHIRSFLTLIPEPDFLNLFLIGISADQITKPLTHLKVSVDAILATYTSILTEINPEYYINTITTCEISNSPPRTKQALERIQMLPTTQMRESALKYLVLIYKDSADALFDFALGLYDFPLVILVSTQTNRDPRSYIALIAYYNTLPELERKFQIDVRLSKFDSALEHLMQMKDWERVCKFVEEHCLFKIAITMIASGDHSEGLVAVAGIYAEYLKSCMDLDGAAIMFRMNGDLESALEMHISLGDWKSAFVVCAELGKSQEIILEIAGGLQDTLCGAEGADAKSYGSVAQMWKALERYESSIEYFCIDGRYLTALQLVNIALRLGTQSLLEELRSSDS